MRSPVWIFGGSDRREATKALLEAADLKGIEGGSVLIKPNLNTADPTPGSSHIDTIDETMRWLRSHNIDRLVVGDRSGPADTREVFTEKGIFEVAGRHSANPIVFDEMDIKSYKKVEPEGMHWRNGFHFVKLVDEVDAVIGLCCLKTHAYGGHFTLSLKLATGMVHRHNMSELHSSLHMRQMIAEMNQAYTPRLMILDGVEGFFNGGPMTGERWRADVTLASADRVALDAIGVALLKAHGTNPEIERKTIFGQDQIHRAVQLGLGAASHDGIEMIALNPTAGDVIKQIEQVFHNEDKIGLRNPH